MEGEVKQYYKSGVLQQVAPMKNDLTDGLFKSYDENGLLKAEIMYRQGFRSGAYKEYDRDGNLITLLDIKDSAENGRRWKFYKNGQKQQEDVYAEGYLIITRMYDELGALVDERVFEKDKPDNSLTEEEIEKGINQTRPSPVGSK